MYLNSKDILLPPGIYNNNMCIYTVLLLTINSINLGNNNLEE